jgi:hypothetical protein
MRLFTFLVIFFSVNFSRSQDYIWATADTSHNTSGGTAIAIDAYGNFVASIRHINDSKTLDGGVDLIKYNSQNTQQWRVALKGIINPGNTIIDKSGNVYFTAGFRDTLQVQNQTFISSCESCVNMILLKFNKDGELQWATRSEGDYAWGSDLSLDLEDNVYLSGYVKSYSVFDGDTINEIGSFTYLAKYTSRGEKLWLTYFKVNCAVRGGLKTDSWGNSYLCGTFFNWMKFGDITLTSKGGYDIYFTKINSSGKRIWLKGAGGLSDDYGGYLDSDTQGNLYIAGTVGPDATIGTYSLSALSSEDYFIAKLDTSGNTAWAINGWKNIKSFCADPSGNTYVSTHDKFMVKYDDSGNLIWSHSKPTVYNVAMQSDVHGNIFTTGHFFFNADFGDYAFTYGKSSYNYQVHATYIAKLSNEFTVSEEYANEKSNAKIFPNPSAGKITIDPLQDEITVVKVYDSFGKIIYSGEITDREEIDLGFASGVYLIELLSEGRAEKRKIIIQ